MQYILAYVVLVSTLLILSPGIAWGHGTDIDSSRVVEIGDKKRYPSIFPLATSRRFAGSISIIRSVVSKMVSKPSLEEEMMESGGDDDGRRDDG